MIMPHKCVIGICSSPDHCKETGQCFSLQHSGSSGHIDHVRKLQADLIECRARLAVVERETIERCAEAVHKYFNIGRDGYFLPHLISQEERIIRALEPVAAQALRNTTEPTGNGLPTSAPAAAHESKP